jgi:hypothetical protein
VKEGKHFATPPGGEYELHKVLSDDESLELMQVSAMQHEYSPELLEKKMTEMIEMKKHKTLDEMVKEDDSKQLGFLDVIEALKVY